MQFNIPHADRNKSGIYAIRNQLDQRLYVGATKGFGNRFREHRRLLRQRRHYNTGLQESFDSQGTDHLSFELIELCAPEMLLERETYFIYLLDAINPQRGFNKAVKGWKMPDSAKLNMSNSGKGKVIGEETRAKMSAARKGRLTTRPGYKLSENHKAALAQGLRHATEEGRLQGRVLTQEHKSRISSSSKGRIISNETRDRMSAASKVRANDPELKASFVARMKICHSKKL